MDMSLSLSRNAEGKEDKSVTKIRQTVSSSEKWPGYAERKAEAEIYKVKVESGELKCGNEPYEIRGTKEEKLPDEGG